MQLSFVALGLKFLLIMIAKVEQLLIRCYNLQSLQMLKKIAECH